MSLLLVVLVAADPEQVADLVSRVVQVDNLRSWPASHSPQDVHPTETNLSLNLK